MERINEISDQGIAKSINFFLNRTDVLFSEQKHMSNSNSIVQFRVFYRLAADTFHTKKLKTDNPDLTTSFVARRVYLRFLVLTWLRIKDRRRFRTF